MNKNILFVAALAATLSLSACGNKENTEETQAEAAEAMSEAVEEVVPAYVGAYEGTIAQADGAGFVTTLVLNADGTYALTQAANGGEAEATTENGNYVYNEEGAIVTLTNAEGAEVAKYAFQGDKVVMVAQDGTMPETPEMYTLNKKVAETAAAIAEGAAAEVAQ